MKDEVRYITVSICSWYDCLGNTTESTQNDLSQRDFSKPAGYNLEHSLAFLYTSSSQLWKTVKK